MKVADVKKWVKALRSGKYKQTQKHLQDQRGHCCLGVACEIFIPKGEQLRIQVGPNQFVLGGEVPESQAAAPEWLKTVSDDFYRIAGIELIQLNDGVTNAIRELGPIEFTFDEIADLLELVYIHKIITLGDGSLAPISEMENEYAS